MAAQPKFDAKMSVVILHGKDSFLMTRYTSDLEDVMKAEHGDVDRVVFDGERVDLATVLDELRTYDMLMRHKLVIVDHADTFLAAKDSGTTLTRKVLERYAESPVDSATFEGLGEATREILGSLTPREAKVLRMRFGIDMNTDHTLEEVGKQFDVTRERIRQIEAKALRKLRHPSRSEQLRSFLEVE